MATTQCTHCKKLGCAALQIADVNKTTRSTHYNRRTYTHTSRRLDINFLLFFFRERARHCADSDGGGRGAIGQRAFTRRRLPLREKARSRRSVAYIVCQDTGGACTAAPQTVQHSLLRVSDLDRRYNEFAEYVRKYRRMA